MYKDLKYLFFNLHHSILKLSPCSSTPPLTTSLSTHPTPFIQFKIHLLQRSYNFSIRPQPPITLSIHAMNHAAQIPLSKLPWKRIFTSIRVYALMAAHFANNWGFYTMLTCLPLFFSKVLKFDIKSVSALLLFVLLIFFD